MKKIILPALGVYSLTSYFLLKNPTILHKKNRYSHDTFNKLTEKPGEKVLSIAHRGGSFERIENTIDAFQNAIDHGADLLEMDLQLTKDGVVVVCHDDNLSRLCGVNVSVENLNYNELPKFSEKINLDHFGDATLDTSGLRETKFATLEEVFQKFPNIFMSLDLKGGSSELTKKTNELIQRYNRQKYTIWGAMGDDSYLRTENPDIARFFSPAAVAKVYLLYFTGLLPFMKLTNQVFSVPKHSENYKRWKSQSGATTKTNIIFAIFKGMESLSKPLLDHMQARGIMTFHWVLNEEADFEKSSEFNVNGIMTDKPGLLTEFLRKRNQKIDRIE